ncbi:MAG TPA: hypothetical protein VKB86_14680 [Pyrinomonadaceae bacterium]|nr:hypothetical protein [Pyrinomonadaceae bacterium]
MNAIFTLLGIVVGAIVSFLLTRRHEYEKQKRLLVTQAYSDYLRAVADAAHLNLESNLAEIHARLADAKTRICLYGSQEVVTLLAAFEKEGGVIGNENQRHLFALLIFAMRGNAKVQRSDLETVLFGDRAT